MIRWRTWILLGLKLGILNRKKLPNSFCPNAVFMIMKLLIYPFLLSLVILVACDKDHDPEGISDCMNQKIEDFKTSEPFAQAVVQINAPSGKLFWFQLDPNPPDAGEDVFDNDCIRYCNFNCFCDESVWCDADLLSYPMDIVWQR